jgi:hypothetical protein
MSTTMRPNMISMSKNMHFRLPVFFWYLKQKKNASGWFTIGLNAIDLPPGSYIKLFHRVLDLYGGLLDIVFHAVE